MATPWKTASPEDRKLAFTAVQSRTGSPVKELVVDIVNSFCSDATRLAVLTFPTRHLAAQTRSWLTFDFAPAAFLRSQSNISASVSCASIAIVSRGSSKKAAKRAARRASSSSNISLWETGLLPPVRATETFVASVALGTKIAMVLAHSFVSDRTFRCKQHELCAAYYQDRIHG